MKAALSLITLGVADVGRSAAFYDRLGWSRSGIGDETVAFYQLGAIVLSLFDRSALAADTGLPDEVGPTGIRFALAQNVASPQAVHEALAEAVAAGGRLVKPGQATAWGGFAGYFADPDGHLWEIAHNPSFALDAQGHVRLPET